MHDKNIEKDDVVFVFVLFFSQFIHHDFVRQINDLCNTIDNNDKSVIPLPKAKFIAFEDKIDACREQLNNEIQYVIF